MRLLLLFLFVTTFLSGRDPGLIPTSYQGRFQPLENVPKEVPLYILPSQENPAVWLPLTALFHKTNETLFSDSDWRNLKSIYEKED